MPPSHEITGILGEISSGDSAAVSRLLPLVYSELRVMADAYFRRQPRDHTLQPTALVHEAFLKLVDTSNQRWNDRVHFFAVAATAMRQVLVSHAVAQGAIKRGGGRKRVDLDEAVAATTGDVNIDILALDEALKGLAALDERMHRVVEMRIFGGLTLEEIAQLLEVSRATVEGDWRGARAWLNRQLTSDA